MKKISVIIPVYNTEQYLDACIQSILNQTFRDFELILINDGSTDTSLQICEKHAIRDDRILIINQENQGSSGARNSGIKRAEGKYIIFIDSDDTIIRDAFSLLYSKIENCKTDLAIAGFEYIYSYKNKIIKRDKKLINLDNMLDKESVINGLIKKNNTPEFNYVWNKLYKADIIKNHNIYFDKQVTYAEDLLFNTCYLRHTNSISVLNKVIYYYHIRLNMKNSLSLKPRADIFENSLLMVNWWEDLLKDLDVKEDIVSENLKKLYIRRTDLILRSLVQNKKDINCMEIISKIIRNNKIREAYAVIQNLPLDFKITVNTRIKYLIMLQNKYLLYCYISLREMKSSFMKRIATLAGLSSHASYTDSSSDQTSPS